MFIKIIIKSNKNSDQTFVSHRLAESYRTENGPRHRTILNLGKLELDPKYFKVLADRIEQIICGIEPAFSIENEVELLAQHYAAIIINKNIILSNNNSMSVEKEIFESVNINTIRTSNCRTVGLEQIVFNMMNRLKFTEIFKGLNFSDTEIHYAFLSIIGRLVNPTSENATMNWIKKESAVNELLGKTISRLSKDNMYSIIDKLISNKDEIEIQLRENEKSLFGLKEKIILYDLTNTYFEGSASANEKAKHGRSKEKRSDCRLVSLALVIDELGFPKRSKILEGNISEPKTLLSMINNLCDNTNDTDKPTILIDAGIASEDNLNMLKNQGYDYICVARNNPLKNIDTTKGKFTMVKKDIHNSVEVKMFKEAGEQILYCKSLLKGKKEVAMKNLYEQRFECGIKSIEASIHKPRGTKNYAKVLERIGRLKEKAAPIAQYYEINIENNKDNIVTKISWKKINEDKKTELFNGTYILRSSRTDINEQEMWDLYVTLTKVENTFRTLKTDLNMRPVYHQKTMRCDGHIFITMLAYHVVTSILNVLKTKDLNYSWSSIRTIMKTMMRVTTSMKTKSGEQLILRTTTNAEYEQVRILSALGMKSDQIGTKITRM